MNRKRILIVFGVVVALAIAGYFIFFHGGNGSFTVDTILLKSVIKQGGVLSNNVEIKSLEGGQNFRVYLEGVSDMFSPSETEFVLGDGESTTLKITFDDGEHPPGVYVGELVIEGGGNEKRIPVILDIQGAFSNFALNLQAGPSYKQVSPGETVSVEIRAFNLIENPARTVDVVYSVLNSKGSVVISEQDSLAMGSSITKTFSLPEDLPLGAYVFTAVAMDEASVGTASYLFKVVDKKTSSVAGSDSIYLVIFIFAFLFAIVLLVIYMFYERNKLFLELRKQQTCEMKNLVEKLREKEKVAIARAKKPERKIVVEKFKKIEKSVVAKVKQKQKKQRIEFKKLKKQNRKSEMEKKLQMWKKEGFNVGEFASNRKVTGKDVRKLTGQGYRI